MQLPLIFGFSSRYSHDAPYVAFARMITNQLPNQTFHIDSICLGSLPSFDVDRCRVHNDVNDPSLRQRPVYPETLSARFITTDRLHCAWQPKMCLRRLNLFT